MASEAPPFWWQPADWRAWALSPLSFVYGRVARYRMDHAPRVKIDAPVLCVGNFTVGGAGKTPVTAALARAASLAGRKPGIVSRGHGGMVSHPQLVDPEHDIARHVGDEPLLLAREAPVAVSPDRAAGARLLLEQGCDFIVMDDGFQSARLHMDFALVVVDARRGLGNGHLIPGGPVRAPVVDQLRLADGLLVMGEGPGGEALVRRASRAGKPVWLASVQPINAEDFAGRRYLAFAGIGEPEKFYDTLEATGAWVSTTRSFGDHHTYSDDDLRDLIAHADSADIGLATTAKDAARLRGGSGLAQEMLERVKVLEIETVFDLPTTPGRLVELTLQRYRQRRGA